MSYEKQTFIDRVVDNSGKVVTEGTKLTAAHLQHIEEGIVEVESAATAAQSMADSAASNATSGSATIIIRRSSCCPSLASPSV